jgi:NAD(P)H dehydrogenase (quinone)
MKIGITGAGGQLSKALVRHTLDRVPASKLVAVTRHPDKLEEFSRKGVDVRGGDFNRPSDLAAAFQGIERLVIIPTADLQPGFRRRQHTAAIQAAAASRVQHVMYISTVGARPDPNNELIDSHFATDQALINSGLAGTILRMSVYMDPLIDAARRTVPALKRLFPERLPLPL